jgi:hypothetical protein
MSGADHEGWAHLSTRIPVALHRRLKVRTVSSNTTLMDFIVAALEEKLARDQRVRDRG